MPSIPLDVRNFPVGAAIANGSASLNVSWPELVWGALSVGRGSLAHVMQHGNFSLFEMVYRTAILYANLVETPTGNLLRSSAYRGLDPSEKGAISYFLGIALTKVFVSKSLGVDWLMHVDVYRQRFHLNVAVGGGRPDLFGQDSAGQWVVAESKGRTNGHCEKALSRAKAQASQVTSIGGVIPHLSVGLVASFPGGRLSLVADDPPIDEKGSRLQWDISREQFLDGYYRPFRTMVEELGSDREFILGREVRVVQSRSGDFAVGLDEQRLGGDLTAERTPSLRSDNAFLGPDGVYVRLGDSWRTELMRKEPQARS